MGSSNIPFIYGTLVLLFLWLHKLRIKQRARFGDPFGLQTSLIFMGSLCNEPLLFMADAQHSLCFFTS